MDHRIARYPLIFKRYRKRVGMIADPQEIVELYEQ